MSQHEYFAHLKGLGNDRGSPGLYLPGLWARAQSWALGSPTGTSMLRWRLLWYLYCYPEKIWVHQKPNTQLDTYLLTGE